MSDDVPIVVVPNPNPNPNPDPSPNPNPSPSPSPSPNPSPNAKQVLKAMGVASDQEVVQLVGSEGKFSQVRLGVRVRVLGC